MSEKDIEIVKKAIKDIEHDNTTNTNYPDQLLNTRDIIDILAKEESEEEKIIASSSLITRKNSTDYEDGWEFLKQSSTPPLDLLGNKKFQNWEDDDC